jgi:hypothetical protein
VAAKGLVLNTGPNVNTEDLSIFLNLKTLDKNCKYSYWPVFNDCTPKNK